MAKKNKVMKCKCMICEYQTGSNPGMCNHLQREHGVKMKKGVTWDWLPGYTFPAAQNNTQSCQTCYFRAAQATGTGSNRRSQAYRHTCYCTDTGRN
ncbi:hypothetical protein LCGC14_1900900 [marine sediment metagenome]|uniref:Uncharacterized protein n=1 Tax=marine sediment metagenome TaxID=412755 RepID=A0A0F9IUQ4_9ZZZZ